MGVPFNVYNLMDSCKKIEGFDLIKEMMGSNIVYSNGFKYSIDEVIGEYEDWDSGHGFGSSDYTYARQSLTDKILTVHTSFSHIFFVYYICKGWDDEGCIVSHLKIY